jgi:hypothetical protein
MICAQFAITGRNSVIIAPLKNSSPEQQPLRFVKLISLQKMQREIDVNLGTGDGNLKFEKLQE